MIGLRRHSWHQPADETSAHAADRGRGKRRGRVTRARPPHVLGGRPRRVSKRNMTISQEVEATLRLRLPPQLASWDAAGSASQSRLAAYLADAEELLRPEIDSTPDPLALHLAVGLPANTALLRDRDLDNYLLPLVQQLARSSGRTFASATAVKRHAKHSFVGVGPAQPAAGDQRARHLVRTTASAESSRYKEQIRTALADADPVEAGPVHLDVVFGVGPTRSWLNLWKPTLDALGALLGQPDSSRAWSPDDGRITRLGLHRRPDDTLGYDVELLVLAGPDST